MNNYINHTEHSLCDLYANTLIKKEIIYKTIDHTIESVHIGILPPKGRYYRQKMEKKMGGYFSVYIFVPKGRTFYHYFINENFSKPVYPDQFSDLQTDTMKMTPVVLETTNFCPIQFQNNDVFFSQIEGGILEIKAITYHQWITEVSIVLTDAIYHLEIVHVEKNKKYWSLRINRTDGQIDYCLRISNCSQTKYLLKDNRLYNEPDNKKFFIKEHFVAKMQLSDTIPPISGYQILPDRFAKSGHPSKTTELKDWGTIPDRDSIYGGNLKGIIEKLPYIKEMGFSFIYLTPVFHANSAHRYDCIDYMQIDPLLGDEDLFREFVTQAHAIGIKIIMDICFNHCSVDFPYFKDILVNQEKSVYQNWFEVYHFPLCVKEENYSCWHGIKELPQFDLSNAEVIEFFKEVIQYWSGNFGIDGWRFDVCAELPYPFTKKMIKAGKEIKEDLIFIGESWQDNASALAENCGIDGITNYSLYFDAVLPLFESKNGSLRDFAAAIIKNYFTNSFRNNKYSWSFLSNHDIARFYSLIADKNNYLPALALIFSLQNTPVIYYGEEICMEGLTDPLNRDCMNFMKTNNSNGILPIIRNLNHIRNSFSNLFQNGSISFPLIDDNKKILEIKRKYHCQELSIIFNFGTIQQNMVVSNEHIVEIDQHAVTYVYSDSISNKFNIFTLFEFIG